MTMIVLTVEPNRIESGHSKQHKTLAKKPNKAIQNLYKYCMHILAHTYYIAVLTNRTHAAPLSGY